MTRRDLWPVLLLVLAVRAPDAAAQTYECTLLSSSGSELRGECRASGEDALMVELEETRAEDAYPWKGTLSRDDFGPQVIDLSPPGHRGEPRGVIRTPFGWLYLSRFERSGETLRLSFSTEDEVPPSSTDLEIVRRATAILASNDVWDRNDDRACTLDDVTWSLYCALQRGTLEVTGEIHHRQPAMQFVRRIVTEVGADRITNHRLMDFNNHPSTTLEEIRGVFETAEARMSEQMQMPKSR